MQRRSVPSGDVVSIEFSNTTYRVDSSVEAEENPKKPESPALVIEELPFSLDKARGFDQWLAESLTEGTPLAR